MKKFLLVIVFILPVTLFANDIFLSRLSLPLEIGVDLLIPDYTNPYYFFGEVHELHVEITESDSQLLFERYLLFSPSGLLLKYQTSGLDDLRIIEFEYGTDLLLKRLIDSEDSIEYTVKKNTQRDQIELYFSGFGFDKSQFERKILFDKSAYKISTNFTNIPVTMEIYFTDGEFANIIYTSLLSEVSSFVKDVQRVITFNYSTAGGLSGFDIYRILFDHKSKDPEGSTIVPDYYTVYSKNEQNVNQIEVRNSSDDTVLNTYTFSGFDNRGNWTHCEIFNAKGLDNSCD